MIKYLSSYKKIFGILGLLVAICAVTAFLAPDSFLKYENIQNTVRWTALFGIISIGVAFVIMTGGIDLSIGSVIGLVGCFLALWLNTEYRGLEGLPVHAVNPEARTITVGGDVSQFESGQTVYYHRKLLTVAAVQPDEDTVVVAETPPALEDNRSERIFAARPIQSIGPEQDTVVVRGRQRLHTRTLVVPGEFPELKSEDRIKLMDGLSDPEFVVHSALAQDGQTTMEFLVRPNQRVPRPEIALLLQRSQRMPTPVAILLVLAVSLGIGLIHGLLITKVGLQPFIVTLCGLLFYRGFSRYISDDQPLGFGTEYPDLKELAKGNFLEQLTGFEYVFDIPMPFVFMAVIAVIAAVFLNKTIYGRYILALGCNEEAARYSGINTDAMVVLAYVICSLCAGVAGILFALDLNSIQPSGHGEFYELYAIAAAVLGGCSLRGGEGSILGVVIAAAVMRVLNNAINLIDGIDTSMEFAIIGMVILLGVIADELVRKIAARRRAALQIR